MNSNTKGLIQACKNLNLPYTSHHISENFFSVEKNKQTYFFCNWKTPLNTESIARICRDKDYCYQLTKDHIKNPKTVSFLSPYSDREINENAHKLIEEMLETSLKELKLPLIVKSNSLSLGTNVFLCENKEQIENAFTQIFNLKSKDYDYVALAQEKISIEKEFRAIFLNGNLEFAYEKNSPMAKQSENISPFHREGARAILIADEQELNEIKNFCKKLFENIKIPYCGLDIAKDQTEQLYLIEINSSPSFDFFERDNGDENIISLYENILNSL